MIKKKRKYKRNPKHIDHKYVNLLLLAIKSGYADDLTDAIIYYNQGRECDDCGEKYYNCQCEKCPDCLYNKCLCDLNLDAEEKGMRLSDEDLDKIRKYTLNLARKTLSKNQFEYIINELKYSDSAYD